MQYSYNDLNPALIKSGRTNGLDTIVRPGKTIRGIIVDHSQLADAIVLDLFHHFYNYFTELGLAGEISNAEWALISAQYPYSLAHFPEAWYLAHAAKTEAEQLKNMKEIRVSRLD